MTIAVDAKTRVVSRFSAGLRFHQMGDLSKAAECYREALRVDPQHPDALHLLGLVALQQGRTDESMHAIRRALELQPDTAEYHNSLGSAYQAAGQAGDAIANFRRSIAIRPDYAVAHHNLGNVLSESGSAVEAAESLRRAEELVPALKPRPDVLDRPEPAGNGVRNETTPATADFNSPGLDGPAFARGATPAAHNERIGSMRIPMAVEQQTVLHVGCGPDNPESLQKRFRGDAWREIRLDIDPDVQPDVVASLTDMIGIEDDSIDALYSSHNLEHLYSYEVPVALAEFFRVLKPSGLAFVTMPDLQQLAHFIVADKLDDVAYESAVGPITPLDCLFGFGKAIAEGNTFMAHKTGFTAKSLRRRLADAGFTDLRTWTTPFALWAEAYKPGTDAAID